MHALPRQDMKRAATTASQKWPPRGSPAQLILDMLVPCRRLPVAQHVLQATHSLGSDELFTRDIAMCTGPMCFGNPSEYASNILDVHAAIRDTVLLLCHIAAKLRGELAGIMILHKVIFFNRNCTDCAISPFAGKKTRVPCKDKAAAKTLYEINIDNIFSSFIVQIQRFF